MTNAQPAHVTVFLRAWRPHVDEIVVAVDERADPRTAKAAAKLADRVEVVPAGPYIERYLGWLHAQCSGDWVLRMDDDELPSTALIGELPELLASREHTHFWLPSRWLTAPDRYVACAPWNVDIHPRLVRNISGIVNATGRVHQEPEILGSSRIVESPYFHVTAALDTVEERCARAGHYERSGAAGRLNGGAPVGLLHVPEGHPGLVTAPLDETDAARTRKFLARAMRRERPPSGPALAPTVTIAEVHAYLHEIPDPVERYGALVRLVQPVETMTVDALHHVIVDIENTGSVAWPPRQGGWPQMRVGHRWYRQDGTALGVEGPRGHLTERVLPGSRTRLSVPIRAPAEAGDFELRIDVLEEFVRWLGTAPATQLVTVLPAIAGPEPPAREGVAVHHDELEDDMRLLNNVLAQTAFAGRYWVWRGTLLGWARRNTLDTSEFDAAEFAFLAGEPTFGAAVAALQAAGFVPCERKRNNDGEVTEWVLCRNKARFVFRALRVIGDQLEYNVYYEGGELGPPAQACARLEAQDRVSFEFHERTWNKPADHERELAAIYGEWRDPDTGRWRMIDRSIITREPWYQLETQWDGGPNSV